MAGKKEKLIKKCICVKSLIHRYEKDPAEFSFLDTVKTTF